MPLLTRNSLALAGLRPLLNPDLCFDDGQEQFGVSEHSGRWVGSLFSLRWSVKDITAAPFSFAPNSSKIVDILEIGASRNWGLQIIDAVIQAKITVPGGVGSYKITMGSTGSPTRIDIILGPSATPQAIPQVDTFRNMASTYGTSPGRGGLMIDDDYHAVSVRWEASGFGTLSGGAMSIVLVGYLVSDPRDSSS